MSPHMPPRDVNRALCRLLGIADTRDVTEVVVRITPGSYPSVEVTRAPDVLMHVGDVSQRFRLVGGDSGDDPAGAHRPAASCAAQEAGVGAVGNACRIPPVYLPATVRTVLPVCTRSQSMGVAFNVEGGSAPVRLRLSVADVHALIGMLQGYLSSDTGNQVEISELMPSVDRSVPSEGGKVAPDAASSTA